MAANDKSIAVREYVNNVNCSLLGDSIDNIIGPQVLEAFHKSPRAPIGARNRKAEVSRNTEDQKTELRGTIRFSR